MLLTKGELGGEFCIPPPLDWSMTGGYLAGNTVRSWRSLVLDCEHDLGTVVLVTCPLSGGELLRYVYLRVQFGDLHLLPVGSGWLAV